MCIYLSFLGFLGHVVCFFPYPFTYILLQKMGSGGQWKEGHRLRAVELNVSFSAVQRKIFYFEHLWERKLCSPETGKTIFFKLLEVIIGCLSALTKVKASKKEAIKFQADHKCRKFKNMNVWRKI